MNSAPAVDTVEPVFFSCGVAGPDLRAGYVADAGGIVAVDLDAGRALWRNDRAWRPLVVAGDRLAAAQLVDGRAEAIQIVLLDLTRRGESTWKSDPVVLPEWVPAVSVRFVARVKPDTLVLEWEAHARYGGGAAPSRQIERSATLDARRSVAVDLVSGAVTSRVGPTAPDAVRRPPVDSEDLEGPWLAGATVCRLSWIVRNGEQTVSLESMDAVAETTVTTIARGTGLVVQVSRDGRFLFVHSEQGPTAGRTWSVFSAETGQRQGTLSHERGAHAPTVLESRAYYMVERKTRALKARELATDTVAWELPLAERQSAPAPRLRQ